MKNLLFVFLLSLFSLSFISGCSNDNVAPVVPAGTIEGTAATGAGIDGIVMVIDANGIEVTVSTSPDGSYSVQVPDLTPPFMIRIIPNGVGETLYSFATEAGQVVNITPLTNLAMSLASGNADLGAIYMNWDGTGITATQVATAETVLTTNLTTQITAAGLDPATFDLFNDAFNADGTGIDGVLDDLTFSTDTNGVISFVDETDSSFTFNPNIDTGGGTGGANRPLGAGEEVAVIPASIVGTYNLTFNESTTGSGITDGTMATFVVAADGSLTIDGSQVLTNPVLYLGNAHEAIWFDTVNNRQYALSSLLTGFNEINVGSGVHFDDSAFTFYGQYREAVVAVAFVCDDTAGNLDVAASSAADAVLTGVVHCPGSQPTLIGNTQLFFVDPGGPDFTAHPSSSLTVFQSNGPGNGSPGMVSITYTVGSDRWKLENANGTLASLGVALSNVAGTVIFNSENAILTPDAGAAAAPLSLSGTLTFELVPEPE